jgi:membrane protease YdiL (CAAX protease family)
MQINPPRESWARRLPRTALARIAIGTVAVVAPVALSMGAIHAWIDRPSRQVWPQLLAALLCLGAYCWFVRLLEKRPVDELAARPAPVEFASGLLVGLAMTCGVAAILWSAGVLQFAGVTGAGLLAPLAEMTLAAVLEEVLFRGVLLRILVGWLGVWKAFVISCLLFGLAHLQTEGFSAAAFVGIVLAGALLSAAYLLRGRLWLPIGLHLAWNFTTTAIFGLSAPGSGNAPGYLRTTVAGPDWITGGSFGVEASLVTLVVTAAVAAALLALRHGRPGVADRLGVA